MNGSRRMVKRVLNGRRLLAAGLLLVLGLAGYVIKERQAKYHPYKAALYVGLSNNDWAAAYGTEEDTARLRAAFAFLENEAPRARVLRLIDWINRETSGQESWTVRAVDILEGRRAACEIHALAIAVLRAFGTRARWLTGVRGRIGFGYLEAYVEGRWEVFQLRAEPASLGVSGWTLYETREPSIGIRTFYPKPGERLQSHAGDTHVAILPFASVKDRPELEPIFRSDRGIDVRYETLNPYDYVFGYERRADKQWVEAGAVYARLQAQQLRFRHRRRHLLGAVINRIDGWIGYEPNPR